MEFEELLKLRDKLKDAIDTIDNELLKMDWRHLANRNLKFLAILAYRRQVDPNGYLSDAKNTVENFIDFINAK